MKRKPVWPMRVWALIDYKRTYLPSIHHARYAARDDLKRCDHLIDADWRILKVEIRPVRKK
jgi:hypothetical protein